MHGFKHSIRPLHAEEIAALVRFAMAHGRFWKRELREVYWYNARPWRGPGSEPNDGGILHALRNDPRWSFEGLEQMKIKRAVDGATAAYVRKGA